MDRDKTLQQAEKYLKGNKPDKALKEYQKVLDDDPHNMRVKLKVGDLYAKKKDTARAITIYRETGQEYEAENFHLKAIAVYKSILQLNPTLMDINEKLGNLYHKVGLTTEAIHQLSIVANHYDQKGKGAEALAVHQKLAEMDPTSASLLIRLAEIYQGEGKIDEAVKEYEKAAALYKKTNDLKGLVDVYQKVLFRRPKNLAMFRALLKIFLDRKEFPKIVKQYESAAEELKNDLLVKQIWAETLVATKQMEFARHQFKDLYKSAVGLKDATVCAQLYARILQEFRDDADYIEEVNKIRTDAKFEHPILKASTREDMEKTTVFPTSGS